LHQVVPYVYKKADYFQAQGRGDIQPDKFRPGVFVRFGGFGEAVTGQVDKKKIFVLWPLAGEFGLSGKKVYCTGFARRAAYLG
jgi:hypothetical protein